LEIIGPVDDRRYWTECRSIIEKLPPNISVSMLGAMDNASALERLTKAHFFVLPTLSENFGYVCIEALSAGCPLIISDRTDWNWVEDAGAGWAIPLEDRSAWSGRLLEVVAQTRGDYARMSSDARNIAVKWLEEPKLEAATAELFDFAIGCGRSVK
jgi:glycosyltransferase involved in cell wall biosynthesis